MKKIALIICMLLLLLCGCVRADNPSESYDDHSESTAEADISDVSDSQTGDLASDSDGAIDSGEESDNGSSADTSADTDTDTGTDTDADTDAGTDTDGGTDSGVSEDTKDEAKHYEDEFVRTPPDVSVEMYDAGFWTDKKYDKIIMTKAEIDRYNSKAASELGASEIGYYRIDTVPNTVTKEFVRHFAGCYVPDNYKAYYVDGKIMSYDWWKRVVANANASSVTGSVSVKFGYSVSRSTLREFPVDGFMTDDKDNPFDDLATMGFFNPFCRVIVIHESADGKWYYVLTDTASGWVKKEEVALCKSRSDWNSRYDPDDFLIVTGKELRMTYDFALPEFSNLLLPMGTKLPLVPADKAPEYINGRLAYGNYIVKLPSRGSNGYIVDKYALIPLSWDVSVGYLDYTRNNVIELSFKFLGDIYGYKGSMHSVNCSGMVRAVFSCFGLYLPGLATNQQRASGQLERIVLEGMSNKEKEAVLDTVDAGTLVFFTGHIMVYLGEYDGEYYVISATGGYHEEDAGEKEVPYLYNVSVNTLDVYRDNGLSWIEDLWCIQLVRYAK